jgi:prepilin-type N-terminal cleavage/methylation domain-containing protein
MTYKTSQSGFSLVETLVAITILLLVIIGPLTISSSSVRGTAFASEQVVAFFLAQEGAELAQKARDEFVLEHLKNNASRPTPWADFVNTASGAPFAHCFNQASGCGMEITNDSVGSLFSPRSCATLSDCALYLDTTSSVARSRYTHTNSYSPTAYTRAVKFTRVSANEVSVVSTVTWRSGFSRDEQRVSVQTSLFNVYGTN